MSIKHIEIAYITGATLENLKQKVNTFLVFHKSVEFLPLVKPTNTEPNYIQPLIIKIETYA